MKNESLKQAKKQALIKTNLSNSLPKTMKQLKALLFTAYLIGKDDEQKGGRSFTDWYEDVIERH